MWFRTFLFSAAFLFGLSLVLVIGSCLREEDRPLPEGPAPRERLSPLWEAPEFELTGAAGDRVSRDDLQGKVWMANFIFTRCPGPCPLMTRRMRELQARIEGEPAAADVAFVSFSVDPEFDTPEVLAEYARRWNADLAGWHFLTGAPLDEVKKIARGFRLGVELGEDGLGAHGVTDSDEEIPPVLHSTRFLLVDRAGRVREVYDSEAPGFVEIAVEDILTLLRER